MNPATCCVLVAYGALLAPAIASATQAPFSFDAAPGRLPKDVVPLDYTIAVTPHVAAHTFSGMESITLRFRSAAVSIVFNSLNETLQRVRVDGKPVKRVVSNNDRQLTTVTLTRRAPAGIHTLTFSYHGKIETAPQGLFVQPYLTPQGGQGLLLSTQMEATDARRLFPCWDEPAFRATYQLSATVPVDWATVSNMPVARRIVHGALASTTFQRSPRMPSYLVEFSAGALAELRTQRDGIGLGVWAVRGREQDGRTALANAQQILADYNDYFGYRYPLPKLDSIAIPGGFGGAMENWGAITYNDQDLLLTSNSTLAERQEVFSIQAHEMAHQWNGDLVTMGWWDDLWLNESFASWRSAKETALRNPSWNWWELQDADKEEAMAADASVYSRAIQHSVSDELQASNAFDPAITYSKGQAVLRMLEAYLGDDIFRDGIRSFIKARAFSNATTADLWNALGGASGKEVAAIAAGWTEQPGFPLIGVAARCDADGQRQITLTQHRFLLRGTDPNGVHWRVPLQIRSGADGGAQPLLLTEDGQTVAAGRCDTPLSLNADAIGFYRTQYDPATLATNTREFSRLRDADRIALLDDQWALVEAGTQALPTYLALAGAMGDDLDTRAWEQIADALGTIEYDERGRSGHEAFAAYARALLRPVAGMLGWDAKPGETPDRQRLRRSLIGDLGVWGDQDVVAEARKRFNAFVTDRRTIADDDQELILSIVARNADAATFEQLHAIAKQSKNDAERQRYYSPLMAVRDPQLAVQAAKIALSSELPEQSALLRLTLVFALADEQPQLSWATFSANAETLLAPETTYAVLDIAQYVPSRYWDALPLEQLEAWVRSHVPAEMSAYVEHGMETARFKLSEQTALSAAADAYVSTRATLSRSPAGAG